jgi:hypothetical protein
LTVPRGGRGTTSLLCTLILSTALVACSESSVDAFCDRAETAAEIGPVFPARTDGEPVPDLAALAALEAMAEAAPDELVDEMEVLVDTARALTDQARARQENGSEAPDSGRWSRRAVDQAQRAVLDYIAAHCDIDLSAQHSTSPSSPPEVTG